jgi:hypothetical protein
MTQIELASETISGDDQDSLKTFMVRNGTTRSNCHHSIITTGKGVAAGGNDCGVGMTALGDNGSDPRVSGGYRRESCRERRKRANDCGE